jgi:transcriptional regulator with XRE-family HTH domain
MEKPTVLRKYRKLSRFTQDEVFARSGISQARISRLEIGNVRPSQNERQALSRVLKVPVEILFPDEA